MKTIGVDLGGTNMKAALVDETGQVLQEISAPTNLPRPAEAVCDDIAALCLALSQDQQVAGIGVGCPGTVDGGVVRYSNNLAWHDFDMAGYLRQKLDLPVYLGNDANVAALGEALAGCAKGAESAVIITLGTGVGGGVVLDGKLLTGYTGAAAEPGHMVILGTSEAPLCTCGRRGCFESLASATALIRMTREARRAHPDSALNTLAPEENDVNGRTAFDAAAMGDTAGKAVVEQYTTYLAMGIAGMSAATAVVVIICLVAFIAGSAYGIFFAAEAPDESSITVQQAVEQLTGEYRDELEHISDTVPHDRQEIEANDDVYYIRWQDVLAVFSSRVSGAEDGAPVAALDETRLDELREILWDMNEVSYTTREETVEVPAQNANTEASRDTASESTANDSGAESQKSNEADTTTITQTVLTIHLTHKTPEEMQTAYNFTARQAEYLPLLQDPEYETLWAELLGGFAAGSSEILMPDTTHTPTGTLQWPLPIPGSITSPFGYRTDPLTGETSYHDGTDITVPESTPILADADGTVTVANALDSWGGSYGYYVQIDHSSGLQTLYAHCSQICVTQGQQVQAGQVIAYVGHTGRATGNHLHFEVRENGERVDAMSYYQ